jgi:hypothetical protein
VSYFEQNLGKDNASRVLKAYGIELGLDKNLFWTRLNTLAGDLMFSRTSLRLPFHAHLPQPYFHAS